MSLAGNRLVIEQLSTRESRLSTALESFSLEHQQLNAKAFGMATALGLIQEENELLTKRVLVLSEELSSQTVENSRLRTSLSERDHLLDVQSRSGGNESELRQELLEVKGRLGRVVFVVDRSASMKQGGRWGQARKLIESWLMHLPVKEAALVVFNHSTRQFPADGSFLRLDTTNRLHLVEPMQSLVPEGKTRTLKALKKAFGYTGVDTNHHVVYRRQAVRSRQCDS